MSSWDIFMSHDGPRVLKWEHYFPIYDRHFAPWRGRDVTVLEVGVYGGGSMALWRRFFGPLATIVGIDIDPDCAGRGMAGAHVRIGDQSDPVFLASVIEEFGVPDVVLDDGSHRMDHVRATFDFLYPKMPKNAVYMVEDMHTAYWPEYGGGVDNPNTFINHAKTLIDSLNADHARGAIEPDAFTRSTYSISFYDSVVAFEKMNVRRKTNVIRENGLFYEAPL